MYNNNKTPETASLRMGAVSPVTQGALDYLVAKADLEASNPEVLKLYTDCMEYAEKSFETIITDELAIFTTPSDYLLHYLYTSASQYFLFGYASITDGALYITVVTPEVLLYHSDEVLSLQSVGSKSKNYSSRTPVHVKSHLMQDTFGGVKMTRPDGTPLLYSDFVKWAFLEGYTDLGTAFENLLTCYGLAQHPQACNLPFYSGSDVYDIHGHGFQVKFNNAKFSQFTTVLKSYLLTKGLTEKEAIKKAKAIEQVYIK